MMLRPYRKEDCEQTARLFYETVHAVNAKDYAPRQLAAWALAVPQPEPGMQAFAGIMPWWRKKMGQSLGLAT